MDLQMHLAVGPGVLATKIAFQTRAFVCKDSLRGLGLWQ